MKRTIFFILCACVLLAMLSCDAGKPVDRELPEVNNYQGLRHETSDLDKDEVLSGSPRVVCFGDSVTFGWNLPYADSYPAILQEDLKKTCPDIIVINSGIAGNTVLDARARLQEDVLGYAPDIVVLNFGLNDGSIPAEDLQAEKETEELETLVSPSDFEENYELMIGDILESGSNMVILGTNAIHKTIMYEETDITASQIEKYLMFNSIMEHLARFYDIGYIDLWSEFNKYPGPRGCLQQDGVHPDQEGQGLIAGLVKDRILYLLDPAGRSFKKVKDADDFPENN